LIADVGCKLRGVSDVEKLTEFVEAVEEKTFTELFVNEFVNKSKIMESSSKVTSSASDLNKITSLNEVGA
jgi:hypothetical protein